MRFSNQQYADALHELIQKGDRQKIFDNFRLYLKKNGEEDRLGSVLEALLHKEEVSTQTEVLEVITKHHPTKETESLIRERVKELFPGKEMKLEFKIDNKILGGFIIQNKENRYDQTLFSSVKTVLQTLKS